MPKFFVNPCSAAAKSTLEEPPPNLAREIIGSSINQPITACDWRWLSRLRSTMVLQSHATTHSKMAHCEVVRGSNMLQKFKQNGFIASNPRSPLKRDVFQKSRGSKKHVSSPTNATTNHQQHEASRQERRPTHKGMHVVPLQLPSPTACPQVLIGYLYTSCTKHYDNKQSNNAYERHQADRHGNRKRTLHGASTRTRCAEYRRHGTYL